MKREGMRGEVQRHLRQFHLGSYRPPAFVILTACGTTLFAWRCICRLLNLTHNITVAFYTCTGIRKAVYSYRYCSINIHCRVYLVAVFIVHRVRCLAVGLATTRHAIPRVHFLRCVSRLYANGADAAWIALSKGLCWGGV